MKLATGIDTIELARLEEIDPAIRERFINRVFTNLEISQAKDDNEFLGGLFAAKEAVSKALGTGIGFVSWQDIEIRHLPTGQPVVVLHDNAEAVANKLGLETWSISISHDRNKVIAMAVAIGPDEARKP
jgi:holo-[acyl-carrier-protein] synthase